MHIKRERERKNFTVSLLRIPCAAISSLVSSDFWEPLMGSTRVDHKAQREGILWTNPFDVVSMERNGWVRLRRFRISNLNNFRSLRNPGAISDCLIPRPGVIRVGIQRFKFWEPVMGDDWGWGLDGLIQKGEITSF